jgi:N6-adenosine-specific RNA methylase IME4
VNDLLPGLWPFGDMEPGVYGAILADPPWRFRTWNETNQTKSARQHYDLMTQKQMKGLPVGALAAEDCMLVMWAVQPMLDQAFDLMKAWGFRYKTAGAWAKQSSTGAKWSFGTGYILRCSAEFYLIGARGHPRPAVRNVRNLIVAPVREHSRKPDQMHADIERMFPAVRRAELFCRQRRPGWDAWGNQVDKFTEQPAMAG